MPAARDLSDDGERARAPDFVEDDSRTVGFLDLPDLDDERVIAAIIEGFARLDDSAVLTAYCTAVDAHIMSELCQRHGVALVHAVTHDSGITFVLQRSSR